MKSLYHRVLINVSNTPSHYDDTSGPGEWSESRYRQMMYLRQRALESARKQWADYLFVGLCNLSVIFKVYMTNVFNCLIKSSCCSCMKIEKKFSSIFPHVFEVYKSVKFNFQ